MNYDNRCNALKVQRTGIQESTKPPLEQHQEAKPQRRYDIDWLRVLAVLLLFPFHTARIFDTFGNLVCQE